MTQAPLPPAQKAPTLLARLACAARPRLLAASCVYAVPRRGARRVFPDRPGESFHRVTPKCHTERASRRNCRAIGGFAAGRRRQTRHNRGDAQDIHRRHPRACAAHRGPRRHRAGSVLVRARPHGGRAADPRAAHRLPRAARRQRPDLSRGDQTTPIGAEFNGNFPDVAAPPTPVQTEVWLILMRFLRKRCGIASDHVYVHNWIERGLPYVQSKTPTFTGVPVGEGIERDFGHHVLIVISSGSQSLSPLYLASSLLATELSV